MPVGSSGDNSDAIKGRSKEGYCCNIDDGLEARPRVTTALLSSADMKHVPPWAVLTGSGRKTASKSIDFSFCTVALGLHG